MQKKTRRVLGVLLLEFCVFSYLALLGYEFWQQKQLEKKLIHTAKIDSTHLQKPPEAESTLKYFYMPEPSWVEFHDQSDVPWLKERVFYNHNAEGMHDSQNYKVEKNSDTFRIIALGDSYTFGQFVSTPDNWTEVAEVMLNEHPICGAKKVEILNLGVYGYDVDYIAMRYKLLGEKYKPDLIAWFESGSGFRRQNEKSSKLQAECIEKKQQSDGEAISDLDKLGCYLEARKEHEKNQLTEVERTEIGKKYRSFFELYGSKPILLFSYVSIWGEDADVMRSQYITGFPKVAFEQIVPAPAKEDRLPDTHPSVEGHRKIAQSLVHYLQTNEQFVCDQSPLVY